MDTGLHSTKHEEQAYNSCNGIIHSCDGISRLKADQKAAQRKEYDLKKKNDQMLKTICQLTLERDFLQG